MCDTSLIVKHPEFYGNSGVTYICSFGCVNDLHTYIENGHKMSSSNMREIVKYDRSDLFEYCMDNTSVLLRKTHLIDIKTHKAINILTIIRSKYNDEFMDKYAFRVNGYFSVFEDEDRRRIVSMGLKHKEMINNINHPDTHSADIKRGYRYSDVAKYVPTEYKQFIDENPERAGHSAVSTNSPDPFYACKALVNSDNLHYAVENFLGNVYRCPVFNDIWKKYYVNFYYFNEEIAKRAFFVKMDQKSAPIYYVLAKPSMHIASINAILDRGLKLLGDLKRLMSLEASTPSSFMLTVLQKIDKKSNSNDAINKIIEIATLTSCLLPTKHWFSEHVCLDNYTNAWESDYNRELLDKIRKLDPKILISRLKGMGYEFKHK